MSKIIFNIIINTGDLSLGNKGYITYHKVNSIQLFKKFANEKYPNWKFANVYNHSTKEKIEIIKP